MDPTQTPQNFTNPNTDPVRRGLLDDLGHMLGEDALAGAGVSVDAAPQSPQLIPPGALGEELPVNGVIGPKNKPDSAQSAAPSANRQ